MPTTNEKKALWFLALIALSGSAVRLVRGSEPDLVADDTLAISSQLGRVDSVRALRHKKPGRDKRPRGKALKPGEASPLNLDSASADEIEALPGIGAALARRIAGHRDSAGGLGQIEALCEVSGVRPATVERLRPLVTFTAPRRHLSVECGDASTRTRKRTRQTR